MNTSNNRFFQIINYNFHGKYFHLIFEGRDQERHGEMILQNRIITYGEPKKKWRTDSELLKTSQLSYERRKMRE